MPLIGVDLMGSDSSPSALLTGVNQALEVLPSEVELLLFLDKTQQSLVDSEKSISDRLSFFYCDEEVCMKDTPLVALKKKHSSLFLGLTSLKEKTIEAFVTSANTGALVSWAVRNLTLLPGVRRPALCITLPSKKGPITMLDVGANADCQTEHFSQFALMGSALQQTAYAKEVPRVGLLNIGQEEYKGSQSLKKAHHRLQELSHKKIFEFSGNVEPRAVWQGEVDVVVSDGTLGNVFIKTAEGLVEFLVGGLENKNSLENLRDKFGFTLHPGAVLAGIEEIVIKCHGDSTSKNFANAISQAAEFVKFQPNKKMKAFLELL
jgi:phosphate acyltransferase